MECQIFIHFTLNNPDFNPENPFCLNTGVVHNHAQQGAVIDIWPIKYHTVLRSLLPSLTGAPAEATLASVFRSHRWLAGSSD